MILSDYMVTTLGSCMIILVIVIDNLRKINTDVFQRKLFLLILLSAFTGAVFDYIGITLVNVPGVQIRIILGFTWSVYFIARNCTFYFGAVFIDYIAHGSRTRTEKFLKYVLIFLSVYTISLIPNLSFGYYFYVSRDNLYIPGILYTLQTLIGYIPVLIVFIDILLAPRHNIEKQIPLIMVFLLTIAAGTAIDIFLGTTNLIWASITAAILYFYFFVIRSDLRIDNLTGIWNRNSFNDYIQDLSRNPDENELIFIIINIDNLRAINDNFGYTEGDNALRGLASIIKSSTRNTDFTARLGGDEFIIVVTGRSDVQQIIDRINNKIKIQNQKNLHPYLLYISYDYDTYKNHSGRQIQDVLALINEKIYQNKKSQKEKTLNVLTASNGEKNV